MARQPSVVPFADGKPADNLEVEDIGNDEVFSRRSLHLMLCQNETKPLITMLKR